MTGTRVFEGPERVLLWAGSAPRAASCRPQPYTLALRHVLSFQWSGPCSWFAFADCLKRLPAKDARFRTFRCTLNIFYSNRVLDTFFGEILSSLGEMHNVSLIRIPRKYSFCITGADMEWHGQNNCRGDCRKRRHLRQKQRQNQLSPSGDMGRSQPSFAFTEGLLSLRRLGICLGWWVNCTD